MINIGETSFDQDGNLLEHDSYLSGGKIEVSNWITNESYAARWVWESSHGIVVQKTLLFKWDEGKPPTAERYTYIRDDMVSTSQEKIDIKIIEKMCKQILIHEVLKT